MQINISHLQPPLVGAWGQKDKVQPIQSLIQAVEEVRLGFRFLHLARELGVAGVIKSQEASGSVSV